MANSHIQIMKPIRAPRDTIKSKAKPQRAPAVTSDRRLLPGLGPMWWRWAISIPAESQGRWAVLAREQASDKSGLGVASENLWF